MNLLGLCEAPGSRPLVGRQRCTSTILSLCQTVYVRGEAGIGKTRLLEEFRVAARGAGFACHTSLVLASTQGPGGTP